MLVRFHHINRLLWSAINRNRGIDSRSGGSAAWGISALVHFMILGLLAFVTLSNPRSPISYAVLAELAVPEPVVVIDPPIQLPQIAATMRGSSAGGRPGIAGPVAAGLETAPEQAAQRVVAPSSAGQPLSPLDFEPRLPPAADLAVSALGTKLGKGLASGGGFGSGVGDGEGNGSGRQFFELATGGTRFVYVIDGSGSMTEPHREARSKLERVKIELIRSIGGLPVEMEFYVIFFNQNAVPMKAGSLQPATLGNKRKHLEWVAKIQGGGNTASSVTLTFINSLGKLIDHAEHDPRLKGYLTPEGVKVEIVADFPTVANPAAMTFIARTNADVFQSPSAPNP
jgi:hypothetical protein